MYRQILISPKYRVLQNILWRESPNDDLKCIQLQTITYGLTSSAFLATRCLIELARIHGARYPLAAEALKNNTYIDDVIVGAASSADAILLKQELIELLRLGGFELHKWCSNDINALSDIPQEKLSFDSVQFDRHDPLTIKTLGVSYEVQTDQFKFTEPKKHSCDIATKRTVLSYISQFFDPLGLINPIIVKAKLLLQKIWQSQLDWDTPLPEDLNTLWISFYSEMQLMCPIHVQRNLNMSNSDYIQIIGFCDASSQAYGCCIYIKAFKNGQCHINLLCAKSRIAPIDGKTTIPKLELNAAVLLSKLTRNIQDLMPQISECFLFSDSKIVLSWLESLPVKLPAYMGNRVLEIKKCNANWLHTPGALNPADILSRGADPDQLYENNLWWHGPDFLTGNDYHISMSSVEYPVLGECSFNDASLNYETVEKQLLPLFDKISSLGKMIRIMIYVQRFISKCKKTYDASISLAQEYKNAKSTVIRLVQHFYFTEEISCLLDGRPIKSNLQALHPFLDSNNLLRVGGRLEQAQQLPFNKRFPLILPKKCHVTTLIIQNEHISLLHAGLKLTHSSLVQNYWIINAVREIKKVIHKCLKCFRLKCQGAQQLMGSLPRDRITPARIFSKVGIDYFGPVNVKQSTLRRSVISKGYVAVFICFVTKAVHLEAVSDLTTECFLAAFKRFISRRGMPTDVYCDNMSTFKSANTQLIQLYNNERHVENVTDFGAQKGIQFHFIPSYSPNFGGLWEAAVKSAKHHFKRILGLNTVTYEQLNTLIVEIEGILNSRPLTSMSQDLSDFSFLTPGHFLIGCPITAVPEPDVTAVPYNRLRFWRRCLQMKQHFWHVWSKDYISMLNSRTKWLKVLPNLKEGMLVLVKTDSTPPLQWPMGRIEKIFAGSDGMTRVVQVRTHKGSYRRSISSIIVLPIN
ncbi:hypothetical protein ABMA28_000724 [Loxostege sticticalis]|uniref:Integrase catalytic domain-containing protein n=1 Tax=Loxostege sticticalis TaxID=481309 RepID=A0ABD0T609_LOXSC